MMIKLRRIDIMLSVLFFSLGTFVLIFIIVSIVLIYREEKKLRINPIPKLKNNDKRFAEITSKYCHKVYDVKRGK